MAAVAVARPGVAPFPSDERERLEVIRELCPKLTAAGVHSLLDEFCKLVAQHFDTPIAAISFVEEVEQVFVGITGAPIRSTGRESSICAHGIARDRTDILLVPDTHVDDRFKNNSLVLGAPHIRFYAGAPLCHASGARLGMLCLISPEPRTLRTDEVDSLRGAAAFALEYLEQLAATAGGGAHSVIFPTESWFRFCESDALRRAQKQSPAPPSAPSYTAPTPPPSSTSAVPASATLTTSPDSTPAPSRPRMMPRALGWRGLRLEPSLLVDVLRASLMSMGLSTRTGSNGFSLYAVDDTVDDTVDDSTPRYPEVQAAAVGAATAASASALLGVSVFVFAGTQPGEVDVHTRRTRGDTFAYHELVRTMQAELRGRLPFVPEAALTLRRT